MKTMKKLTALALAALLVFSLCACGSSGGGSDVTGTYKLYAMDYDENNVLLAEDLFSGENYVTLKSGGAAEMCMEDDVSDLTWKLDGTNIVLKADDGDIEGTLKDGILTLVIDESNCYFVADGASTDGLHAVSLDEMLNGVVSDVMGEGTPIQQMWNGWYYGCIDMSGCTGNWEFINDATYDAVMYVELDADGNGRLAIYDPFGNLISNDRSNVYVEAECHADESYLYADSGEAFNTEINPSDWRFVRNLADSEKLNVGSTAKEDDGDTIGYDFTFKPWGNRWEGDDYTKFIPYFSSYIDAIDSGLGNPFGETFTGFGIAGYDIPGNGVGAVSDKPAESTEATEAPSGNAAAGNLTETLDVNGRGIVYVHYSKDFRYDDDYGKLKNEDTGVGILIDPMLGSKNMEELKSSYETNNKDEDDYSLVETTVGGYKALILKYSDWLGATMRVDIDFGGEHDGFYGISFAVSGDALEDCDTDIVWAIINSMELAK